MEVEGGLLASSVSIIEAIGQRSERLVDCPGRLALWSEVLDHHRGEDVTSLSSSVLSQQHYLCIFVSLRKGSTSFIIDQRFTIEVQIK